MSDTHPNAYKMEAEDKRRQAGNLLAEAEQLDPTPEPSQEKNSAKVKAPAKKKSAKK